MPNRYHPPGLIFPCTINVKIFLTKAEGNRQLAEELILKSIAPIDLLDISTRSSSHNQYESFGCEIRAESQEKMDELFHQLVAHPKVLLAL